MKLSPHPLPPGLSFPLQPPLALSSATFYCNTSLHHEHYHHLLSRYRSTLAARGLTPHPHAFPPLLKACAHLGLLSLGIALHLHAVILGYASDAHTASSLLHMYAKNGDLDSARRVFDRMPARNVVPWSAMIGAYSQAGDVGSAFSLYKHMCGAGIRPNPVTMLGLLSGVSHSDHLQCVHASVIRCGFEMDLVLVNSLLNVYGKCGRSELAQRLFDSMPFRDIVSWTSMLSCYARIGCVGESVDLFIRMRTERMHPDHQTFGSLISSITDNGKGGAAVRLGELVHSLVITSGFASDAHVETSLISMYLRIGNSDLAYLLFERATDRDSVLWTAMISGLVQNDRAEEALNVFHQMLWAGMRPVTTTVASVLSACAQLGFLETGVSVHGYIVRQRLPLDIAAQNSLISMYAKCGYLRQSLCVFEAMEDRDLVSWNAVVSGHAQNGHLAEAFHLFRRMRSALQRPDAISLVSLLQACASVGALHHGKLVHNFIIRQKLNPSISLDTSLVDMYSKCGDLKSAKICFRVMPEHDLVSWTAIISGYGCHGMGVQALEMYKDFLLEGMEPNEVLFLSLLSACSHSRLVSEGVRIFKSMEEDFCMVPRLEHYGCIIDLLCRAGRVEEAHNFIRKMSPKPNADVLGIILDACRTNECVGLAEEVAKDIISLGPESAGIYIQLVQTYAALGRWDGVGETWARMRALGLKKSPGWSFVELNGTITTFYADHSSYPRYKMVLFLETLDNEMREISRNSAATYLEASCCM